MPHGEPRASPAAHHEGHFERERPVVYFFSMFHIGGTEGTESTPLILSER